MANEKRLIDADALLEEIQRLRKAYKKVTTFTAHNVIACIKIAPTVDAVEVVHAHWEDGCAVDCYGNIAYKSIDCSHCNEIFKVESKTREYWKARFKVCPFCGAVMDGERREGE